MNEHSRVVLAPGVLAAEVAGEVIALSGGAYYDTSGVGAVIWHHLATPTVVGDLVQLLTARYDVAPDVCLADVLAFLRQAHAAGLIQIETEPRPL